MSTQNLINSKRNTKSKNVTTTKSDHDDLTLDDKLIKSDEVSLKCCNCSKLFKSIYRTYITAFNHKCGREKNHFHLLCNSCRREIL